MQSACRKQIRYYYRDYTSHDFWLVYLPELFAITNTAWYVCMYNGDMHSPMYFNVLTSTT